jgi:dTDP-D-glucose 4,6-dehydratase
MSKKLLITGSAGFIGSAVIHHIINNTHHSVINVDKLTYAGNLESLTSIESNASYTFEQVDIHEDDVRLMLHYGDMVHTDLQTAKRDELVKGHGFQVMDYHE